MINWIILTSRISIHQGHQKVNKMNPEEWKNVFTIYVFHKNSYLEYTQNSYKSIGESTQYETWAKWPDIYLTKEENQIVDMYVKKLTRIFSSRGNGN